MSVREPICVHSTRTPQDTPSPIATTRSRLWRNTLAARYRMIAAGMAVTDGVGAAGALLLAEIVVERRAPPPSLLLPVLALAPFVWMTCFHAFGLYGVRNLSALEEFRRLIGGTSVAIGVVLLGSTWWRSIVYRRFFGLSWLLALAIGLFSRRVWRWYRKSLRRDGWLAARTLILGTNGEAARLALVLDEPVLGFRLVGHVAPTPATGCANGLPVVGMLDDLEETIRCLQVDCVFVASTDVTPDVMVFVSNIARRTAVEVRMTANLADVLVSRLSIQSVGDVMALSLRPASMSKTQAALKRGFDILVGTLALAVSAPAMVLIAVAVRLTSSGPALFRQERVTRDGRVFRMLKFRTMVAEGKRLPPGRMVDLTVPFFKLAHDPRLTRVGWFLRRFSLDELPQLWNVVRGDLSLVGPRPLPAVQVAANPDLLSPRHEVRAGITGWWQINGRSNVDPLQALRLDAVYIENWSLSLDLFILLKTVGTVFSSRGAC